ncbi:MAG: MotA/TolQ/ExbB proton channel family protein [uncultured Truepera sp.]|uniref:MotA/TolQ/ExbB proton channel family protein n=1 Tax=uncultured Truepera sp. TaxID=543023 RepID=A0A6J4UWB7_9DEIN|nr:MAG: MotA/TolQ/ExbB proton channel family protein [uncultured Truepera sp.]
MDLLLSGGPVLVMIVLLSLYALYLFFTRLFQLARERPDSDRLMARVNAAVLGRNLEMAMIACDHHGGPVARVLKAALARIPYGRPAVEAAFQEAYLSEEQSLTRGLRPLATIAQVATLLGLLGTVTGMITAFAEISQQGAGNPSVLAGGIGQALVNTAAGLFVAIPTILGHSYLASRVENILVELERRREELMGNVAQAVSLKSREEPRAARTEATQAETFGSGV